MKSGLQFGKWLAALAACAALALPGFAQGGRANRDQNRPPKQEQKQQRQNQQPDRPQRQRQEERRAQREEQRNTNRPPQANPSRPFADERPNRNSNRPPNAPPRTATPQELRRNEQQFNRLPPQQKQEMRERAQAWDRLTPDQRSHIRNDVAPRWQQLPADRQRAIRSRLNVLKNMPESARNQHLNDPNFTRGMSEEDRAMLRDLSHLHIGGPDAPPNE